MDIIQQVRATLAAAKLGSVDDALLFCFSHRYTRTHDLMQEFARSFNNADIVHHRYYAVSEDPIEGVDSEALTNAIKRLT
jgi:UDP-N-acetylmuramate--alanine ligase